MPVHQEQWKRTRETKSLIRIALNYLNLALSYPKRRPWKAESQEFLRLAKQAYDDAIDANEGYTFPEELESKMELAFNKIEELETRIPLYV